MTYTELHSKSIHPKLLHSTDKNKVTREKIVKQSYRNLTRPQTQKTNQELKASENITAL